MSEFNPQFEKLGNILIHQKLITDDQLEAALSEQKTSKDKLGHVLIKQGSITENDLIEVYANQLGYRHILEDDLLKAPEEVVKLLPEDFAVENNVLPLNKSDTTFLVAMEDPEDLVILDSLLIYLIYRLLFYLFYIKPINSII